MLVAGAVGFTGADDGAGAGAGAAGRVEVGRGADHGFLFHKCPPLSFIFVVTPYQIFYHKTVTEAKPI